MTACHCPGLAGDAKASEDVFEGANLSSVFHSSLDGEVYNEATKWRSPDDAIALSGAIPATRFEGDFTRLLKPERAFVELGKGALHAINLAF